MKYIVAFARADRSESDMGFLTVAANRRWYIYVILTFLLWFHIFLMFSAGKEPGIDDLQTGVVTAFQAMERTGSNAVLPNKSSSERDRLRIFPVLVFAAAAKAAYNRINIESLSEKMRRSFGVWELCFGEELTALPHSDMVFRI